VHGRRVADSASTHLRPELSIDQRLALKSAAVQLQSDFGDMFGVETIERFLHSSYEQLAARASSANFLPLLLGGRRQNWRAGASL
jgi:arsenate reductase